MRPISNARIAFLLICFMVCSACGKPRDTSPKAAAEQPKSTGTASDINFIGGGSQIPEPPPQDRPYNSAATGMEENPTSLSWAPDVNMALRIANKNRDYKIIVWFRNPECPDCVKIEREVFTDPGVIRASHKRLWVKLDTGVNRDQAQYYLHGADPPALVFLDINGNEFRHYYGSFTKEDLVSMLTNWR